MTIATEDLPATLTDDFYLQHQAGALSVAKTEWKRSTVFTIEDIEQAVWEHVLANWKHYAIADDEHVSKFMTRAARGYVRQERIDHMYFTGSFIYTPKIVAGFLDTCAWQPIEQVPDVDARVDIIEAFELLRKSAPKQAAAVFKRYGMGESGMSEAEDKNVSRGVETICHRLNSGLRLSAESIDLAISKGD